MREMDYRAWDGEKFWYLEPNGWFLEGETEGQPFAIASEMRWIVEQYSGLANDNSKDIYEGDVYAILGYGRYIVSFPFTPLYKASNDGDYYDYIGNVHENPELLKAKLLKAK